MAAAAAIIIIAAAAAGGLEHREDKNGTVMY